MKVRLYLINVCIVEEYNRRLLVFCRGGGTGGARGAMAPPEIRLGGPEYLLAPPDFATKFSKKLPKTILYCQIRSEKPYFVENFLKFATQSTDRRSSKAQKLSNSLSIARPGAKRAREPRARGPGLGGQGVRGPRARGKTRRPRGKGQGTMMGQGACWS